MNFFAQRLATRGHNQTFSAGRKIRVGTKAISKRAKEAAEKNPAVASILKKLDAGVVSFREAEKELHKLGVNNPFYPRNTREFHAHPWDMGVGSASITQKLLELYGEMLEGDSHPKLYKFPVVFPEVGNDVASLIQGGLSVQGGGPETIRYWSDYDASGARVCKHLPAVNTHDQAQRRQGKPLRMPERQPVTRGLCDPGNCFEFQSGMCRFNGTVNFYIPGITGAGVFQLHTGSTQAATEIYLRLTEAIRATNGRLQNYTPDGRPLFWITKTQAVRPYFDEDGKPKLAEQWVPVLEMQIEMPKVLWLKETGRLSELAAPGDVNAPAAVELKPVGATPSAWMQESEQETKAPAEASPEVAKQTQRTQEHQPQSNAREQQAEQRRSDVHDSDAKFNAHQTASPVDAMLAHAREHGYDMDLSKWIVARFQGDREKGAEAWGQLSQRFGARTRDYIAMLLYLAEKEISAEMTMKYLKIKYGPLGTGARLAEMRKHMEELCSDGASVAVQVMEEAVESASA